MQLLRSRWTVAAIAALVVVVATALAWSPNAGADESGLTATVVRGPFAVNVTVPGELRAMNSISITAPANADRAGAWQMKIAKIVPEGTLVKEGDFVAELDRGPLMTQMTSTNLSLTKSVAVHEQAMLDTTLNLSKAREEIRTLETSLEEKRIAKEQAVYEAPSVRRQAEIDYEKTQRSLVQARTDYKTREEQAQAKMREVGTDLDRWKTQQKLIQDVMEGFTITAPAPGMVIYLKEWNGKKKGVGGQVNPWEGGTVATLPDLTRMESITFVNEIDVRKVSVGQQVALTLDSDPDKRLTGKVVSVANVGEERPNSDAKVFEVKIEVAESDTTLRPGMTTGNVIETLSLGDALFVPLESVTTDDNVPYVFKRTGGRVVKQEVETGALNDTHVVITRGVEEGDVLLLVPPANHRAMTAERLPGSTAGRAQGADSAASQTVPVKPGGRQ